MAVQNYTTTAALKSFASISDSNADTELGLVVAGVNDIIEGYIGRPVGDGGTAARTFDIAAGTKWLRIRDGIRPGTSPTVEYKTATSDAAYTTVTAGQYVWRPADHDRPTNWPADRLALIDDSTPSLFYAGYDTVRVTPDSDGGWGWASIPAELSRIADLLGVRMFQSRQSGDALAIGTTDFGAAIVRFLPEPEYQMVLDKYRGAMSQSFVG